MRAPKRVVALSAPTADLFARRYWLDRQQVSVSPNAVPLDHFLDDHAIGPGRDRRAGEDAHALPRARRPVARRAGEGFADDRELRRKLRQVSLADRVTIHR